MTAQILSSELTNLVQDSKRKNPELRNAADKSLQELKALPSTSEVQLAADLVRRPQFIDPFVKACTTQNARFAGAAVVCLQRLIVMSAVPRSRLSEVLDAFKDSSQLSLDTQLKILQALPSLLQNYSNDIRGELLSSVLQVCSSLQTAKNPAVSGTAAATLQQLVISTFEKVVAEDAKQLEIPTVAEVPSEAGPVVVRPAAHDAYKVFRDICLLTEGNRPQSIRFSPISQASGLELIEAVLSYHGNLFLAHPEQGNVLRVHLMPLVIKAISERLTFPITLRIMRVFNLLLRQHITILSSECGMALGLLNHMLDPDAATPWKRAMCMEIFRNLYSDPNLILQIYSHYDAREDSKPVIRDNLAIFVRLSTEKPSVIGLGQQSTAPVGAPENDAPAAQAALEAGAVAGIIGGAPSLASVPGISTQWSTLRIPCMDHLDKLEPPSLPETYIYSLVLGCINNFSESLAKFILPLTVHKDGKKKSKKGTNSQEQAEPQAPEEEKPKSRVARSQSFRRRTVPVNPLDLKHNPAEDAIKMSAAAINDCWPAVLATCSTFLNAALDADYYHDLVRSIQKFTQIAGLLRLSTPRDAFLTTLGKAAVPPTIFTATVSTPKASGSGNETPTVFNNNKGLLSVESLVSQGPEKNRASSFDTGVPTLSTRNLLCLRALLNLAIALGPTLESAWSIIFETLQQADIIMAAANTGSTGRDRRGNRHDGGALAQSMGSEVAAVQAAASRLFESTVDFPNDSFVQVLISLCALLEGKPRAQSTGQGPSTPTTERRESSFGVNIKPELHVQDYVFPLHKIGDLGTLNANRLISFDPEISGWTVFINTLVHVATKGSVSSSVRLLAIDVLSRLVQDVAREAKNEDQELKNEIHERILGALHQVVGALYEGASGPEDELDETDIEVHVVVLDALKALLEQFGDSLVVGWSLVFLLAGSAFTGAATKNKKDQSNALISEAASKTASGMISTRIGRLSFGSVQLICGDFLAAIPDDSILMLLDLLYLFCDQKEDLNMSLTTITFFWNVSDYLRGRADAAKMEELATKSVSVEDPGTHIREDVKVHSLPAMWLHLLLQIASVAQDRRAEVRNGTLHTLLRIFDNYGDQLTPASWNLCLRAIIFHMLHSNIKDQKELQSASPPLSPEEVKGWVETTRIILNGLVKLFSNYQENILRAPKFSQLWSTMFEHFRTYLTCGSQAVNAVTYGAVAGLLGKIDSSDQVGEAAISQASQIWLTDFPVGRSTTPSDSENVDAFLAYVHCFKEVYRLFGQKLVVEDLSRAASNLRRCVAEEESTTYSSDKDLLTALQRQILESIQMIKTDFDGAPTVLVKCLAKFIAFPFETPDNSGGNTFVALSKASMEKVQTVMDQHIGKSELFTQGALLSSLQSLSTPIRLKYAWKTPGKAPPIWQRATTTALNILGPALANAERLSISPDDLIPIWAETAAIADGIARADLTAATANTPILDDESFDMKSLTALRNIIIPRLGAAYIPSTTRNAYALSLFTTSLIHSPSISDLPPRSKLESGADPLADLYRPRHGRTFDPAPTPRMRMSYVCLRELLALVAKTDGSPERVALAQAAAPFLLLRAGLVLKGYVADQPLRGRLPLPESQRSELLFFAKELRELAAEEDAFGDDVERKGAAAADGSTKAKAALEKQHLKVLYPLIVKAVGVAVRDGEVLAVLRRLLEAVPVNDGFAGFE
ncbi:endosomal peripheral membrane protein-like protein [Phyllosticta citricarpa]|uniref:Endosomal peripheral membrane protein-like protein n=1 Tax=Phyllosticta paracitricarpa TaxID=2016321 RepID=A0ABR1MUF3_9PEZI